MPLLAKVVALNAWLLRHGAQVGDVIIDRATFPDDPIEPGEARYLLCRPLPDSSEATGWVLDSLGEELEVVERFSPPASSGRPWLELVSDQPPERRRQPSPLDRRSDRRA